MTEQVAAIKRLEAIPADSRLAEVLDSMGDAETASFLGARYRPTLLNLHSILHGELPADRIESLAARLTRAATWSAKAPERYLRCLPDAAFRYRLYGWNARLVDDLLSLGRGLLFCTFRYGLYGYLPIEIAARGIEVACPIAEMEGRGICEEIAALRKRMAAASGPGVRSAANILRMRPLDVENPSSILELARIVRAGGAAVIYADGNNGVDGPWGSEGRAEISFFGCPTSVKTGIAKLSLLFRCPILPVFAEHGETSQGMLLFHEPIVPPQKWDPAQDDFTQRCMTRLYGLLEHEVRRLPDQWEGISALHRWRRAPAPVAPAETVSAVLKNGGRLRLNEVGGVVRMQDALGEMWVDSGTMKGFKAPAKATALLQALASRDGVDAGWIETHRSECDEATQAILAELWTRRLITRS
jgi:lauroyl/myristoyl acyltransferase